MNKKKILTLAMAVSMSLSMSMSYAATQGITTKPTAIEGTAKIYTYKPYNQYGVNTKVGFVTDIQLKGNEKVQKVAAGDSIQWKVVSDKVGQVEHIYIKPTVDGLQTNMIINTDKRSYRLLINSDEYVDYIVTFIFPDEDLAEFHKKEEEKLKKFENETEKIEKISKTQFVSNYEVTKNRNVRTTFIPKSVFTDGIKTYIVMNEENRENFPVIYSFDEWDKKKLQLVNYRLIKNVMIVDKKLTNFKLAFSQDSYIMVTNKDKAKIPSPQSIQLQAKDPAGVIMSLQGIQLEAVPLVEEPSKNPNENKVDKATEHKDREEALLDKIDEAINQLSKSAKEPIEIGVNEAYQQIKKEGKP